MTVTNLNQVVNGNQVSLTWDMTLDFAFIMLNGLLVANPDIGITSASIINNPDAYLEILDSDDPNFDAEAAATEFPRHKPSITWPASLSSDIASYRVEVDGVVVDNILHEPGRSFYTYESNKLTGSIKDDATYNAHTIDLKAVDKAGNIGLSSQLPIDILNASPPVRGLSIAQTVLQKINLTIIEPQGW